MAEPNEVLGGIAPTDYTAPAAGYGISSVADPRISALADMLRAKRTATRPESDRASQLQRFKDTASGTRSAMKGQQFMPTGTKSVIRETQDVFFNPLEALEAERRAFMEEFGLSDENRTTYITSLADDLRGLQEGELVLTDYQDDGSKGADPTKLDAQLNYDLSYRKDRLGRGVFGEINPYDEGGFRIGDITDQDILLGQNIQEREVYTPGSYRDYEVRYKQVPESDVRIGDPTKTTFQSTADLGLDNQGEDYANKLFSTSLKFLGGDDMSDLLQERGYVKNPDTRKYEFVDLDPDPNMPQKLSPEISAYELVDPEAFRRLGETVTEYGSPDENAYNPFNDILKYVTGTEATPLNPNFLPENLGYSYTAAHGGKINYALIDPYIEDPAAHGTRGVLFEAYDGPGVQKTYEEQPGVQPTGDSKSRFINKADLLANARAAYNLDNLLRGNVSSNPYSFGGEFTRIDDLPAPVAAPTKTYADYAKQLAANRLSGIGGLAPGLV